MISCMASRILAAAAAATLLSLCVMVASSGVDGSGNATVPDPLLTLTLCVREDLRHEPGPFYSDFVGTIRHAVEAAKYDRSSSHLFGPVTDTDDYALAQCACTGTINYTCDSATVRYDVCLLSFGKRNLSAFDANQQMASAYDVRGSRTNLTDDLAVSLLTMVAANATANASRTAAGIADYRDTAAPGDVASVYGLAQCTTQMSAPDCGRCLRDVLLHFSGEFNASAGMQVVSPSCMVQYASSLFFNASLLPVTHVSVPDGDGAPPPAGSTSLPHGRPARVIALSAGLGGGVAALAVAALVTLWCIRRSRKSKSPAGGGNYSYQTLLDATGNFSEENKLGSGGCGVVYKGILENKQEIAVKKLARKELKELEREVCLVAELQHENLVKFLGHCYQEAEMFLVYEYLRNKCLSNYFKGSVGCEKLDWPKWLNIIRGIARGLCYLHRDSGKYIVHRDLKPSNVLLDSNFAPKIADFDLARGYNRERSHESTRNTAGTYGYIAPECYAEGKFSTKSDVYSYGVMVLEIIAGQSIGRFENENCTGLVEHVWQHWRELRVGDMLDRDHLGLASHEQMQQAARCVQVALLCVQNDRSRRPSISSAARWRSACRILVPLATSPRHRPVAGRRRGIR